MAGRWRALVFLALAASPANAADWQPVVSEKNYPITGSTGIALYESIGSNGPLLKGGRRTIALTEWDLRWRRDYRQDGSACVLRAATPLVKITYTFPRPEGRLAGALASKWDTFRAGIIDHEHVHGALVVDLANRIRAATVGLRVEGDAGCSKIRDEVLKRVKAEFTRYRQENSQFEQSEMREGGNVHRLILDLVN